MWPATLSAFLTHDLQMAGAGVTTVLDSVSLGDHHEDGKRTEVLSSIIQVSDFAASNELLRAEHYFHFRCEVSDRRFPEILGPFRHHNRLRLLSLMDHTPGQGQWRDLTVYRENRQKRKGLVWTDKEFDGYLAKCRERQALNVPKNRDLALEVAKENGILIASHDDTAVEDVHTAFEMGIRISEFPTTLEAAQAAHKLGMYVFMGSPNVVLKKSHSGNVSALSLAEKGVLSGLASDYVPISLMHAAFALSDYVSLPDAIATVTSTPAKSVGLTDRGEIAEGRRADLVRVRITSEGPVVRSVWREGKQII
ncbi:alpha-D-ribose 1-methylphosphonate 5-triphosphate diphosphatase [Ensifer sp. SEMIA 135]|nr:alpha-D-ribose 1-methylphosphonate 5-triphosphate diphosphatase [Ensifer sp. SEMIA 134]TWB24034.1 alpha-D-ribose 1-methylphosphonate 5-triphosphate diphosphatase [Ensifer sp. SEMIA 135]